MSKAKQIHTVPDSEGTGWRNVSDGATVSAHDTKQGAVEKGREIARQENAEHIIHNLDGRIGETNSYGNDPFPPRG